MEKKVKKNRNKFFIVILIMFVIIFGVATFLYLNRNEEVNVENEQKEENKVIVNENENFKQKKEFKDLELSNIKFTFKENESFIDGTITNKSEQKIQGILLDVVLLDEQKNEKGSIYIYIDEIDGKSSKDLNGSIDKNFIDAVDCNIRY